MIFVGVVVLIVVVPVVWAKLTPNPKCSKCGIRELTEALRRAFPNGPYGRG